MAIFGKNGQNWPFLPRGPQVKNGRFLVGPGGPAKRVGLGPTFSNFGEGSGPKMAILVIFVKNDHF